MIPGFPGVMLVDVSSGSALGEHDGPVAASHVALHVVLPGRYGSSFMVVNSQWRCVAVRHYSDSHAD